MPDESNRDLHTQDNTTVDWGLIIVLTLAIIAFLIPHISIFFGGIYWAAVLAVVVFLTWGFTMPTTCMNGGLIFSMIAMILLLNTFIFVAVAIVSFLEYLFF